jgi:ATP-dependent Clp protease adaptor protein ClpS
MYRVLIHDDPKTPMDFVVLVLSKVFNKDLAESTRIMLEAHSKQVALVVVEPLERAEFHVEKAHAIARMNKFPLTFSIEPED